MMRPAALSLERVSKDFGSHAVVRDVTLEIEPGELIVVLGPSGCGKTTTLRMIAGFAAPSSGDIRLDGRSIVTLPPHRREMGIVFQSYALFPHLTVARNVAFGLEMRRMPRSASEARVAEMLRLVKLEAFSGSLPKALSGGQQQRVALARALAINPRVLLLDEPLSNLDAALRQEMAREIRILQRNGGMTTIMVTHDQAEAMAMADRLVVMREGRVQQIGAPEEIHARPVNPFVARFIGGNNILSGRLEGGHRLVLPDKTVVPLCGYYDGAGDATLAVRPDSVHLVPHRDDRLASGTVALCTWLGSVVEHVVQLGPDATVLVRGPALGRDAVTRYSPGTHVSLGWEAYEERLFDASGSTLEPALAGKETYNA